MPWETYRNTILRQFDEAVKRRRALLAGQKPGDVLVNEQALPADPKMPEEYVQSLRAGLLRLYRQQILLTQSVPRQAEIRKIDQFYWLVGYQVKGWKTANIATASKKTDRTIRYGIAKIAASIGLRRRDEKNFDPNITSSQIKEAMTIALRQAKSRPNITSRYHWAIPRRFLFTP
jgi:hypothetical protein